MTEHSFNINGRERAALSRAEALDALDGKVLADSLLRASESLREGSMTPAALRVVGARAFLYSRQLEIDFTEALEEAGRCIREDDVEGLAAVANRGVKARAAVAAARAQVEQPPRPARPEDYLTPEAHEKIEEAVDNLALRDKHPLRPEQQKGPLFGIDGWKD